MDPDPIKDLINLLEDGCVSSLSVEQITKTSVKQALQVLDIGNADRTSALVKLEEKLLDATQYLVKHNKGCFSHLKDVGFLDILSGVLNNLGNRMNEEPISEDLKTLLDLTTETVLAVSDTSPKAKTSVVLQLLPGILEILKHQSLTFLNRLEILKTINILLEQCPSKTKEAFLTNLQNQKKIKSLVHLIQTIGDYEFQVGTVECLMRLFPKKARQHFAEIFITDRCMLQGFLDIKDKDFETDCRHFLNVINAKSEDPNKGVYSVPCLSAYIGNKELHKPSDIKYNEFWVDFNIGSQRVTIFCEQDSLMSQCSNMDDDLWETVAIYKSDVQKCLCQVNDDNVILLEVILKNPVCDIYPSQHQDVTDNTIRIEFNLDLEMHVTHAVAHTFCVTERVNKVSTVAQPLQISLREVQETDSQDLSSVSQSASTHVRITKDAGSQDSSVRSHKVSVPSIPMCSPLSTRSDRETNHQPKKSANQGSTSKSAAYNNQPAPIKKGGAKAENTSEEKNKHSKTEFAAPKTPTMKNTKSKVKVKTPVVLINPLKEKDQAEKREKKKGKKTNNITVAVNMEIPRAKPLDTEIVIPDSLPLEKEAETVTQPGHEEKISTSIRRSEDSGIGADMSAKSFQEISFGNQTNSVTECAKEIRTNDGVGANSELEVTDDYCNIDKEITEGDPDNDEYLDNDVIPETANKFNTTGLMNLDKMKQKKKDNMDKIQCAIRNSFGFEDVTCDVDSIQDSFDNIENDALPEGTQNSKMQKANVSKQETTCRKKKEENDISESASDTKKVKSVNSACDRTSRSSLKKSGMLSLIKDNESLKELYNFEEEEKRISNLDIPVATVSSDRNKGVNGNVKVDRQTCKGHDENTIKEIKEKMTKGKRKQKKQTNDDQLTINMKKCVTDDIKHMSEKEKSNSDLPSRKSKRSKVNRPSYKEENEIESDTEDAMNMLEDSNTGKNIHTERTCSIGPGLGIGTIAVDNSNSPFSPKPSPDTPSTENAQAYENCNRKYVKEANNSYSPLDKGHGIGKNKKECKTEVVKKQSRLSKNQEKQKEEKKNIFKQERHDNSSLTNSAEMYVNKNNVNKLDNRVKGEVCTSINNKSYLSVDIDDSDSLYIEEDDDYNARRYRQEVSNTKYTNKKDSKSISKQTFSKDCSKKHSKEENKSSQRANAKRGKETLLQRNSKKGINQEDARSSENMGESFKGRVGFSDFDSINEGPNQSMVEAKSKSMVFQMSYSKTKTSYRSFDWASEIPVKKEQYDPYDFDSYCDNGSMASERLKRKDISKELNSKFGVSNASVKSRKKEKAAKSRKKSTSKSGISTVSMFQGFDDDTELLEEDTHENKSLLVQDKTSNKWYRKANDKQRRKTIEKTQTVSSPVSDNISTDDDVYIYRKGDHEQNELNVSQPENEVKDFTAIFRDLKNSSNHGGKARTCSNFLPTPRSIAAVVDEVCDLDDSCYDLTKTPNIVTPLVCSAKFGSAKSRGYKPLNISVIKTPLSVAVSDKQETDSEEEKGIKEKQVAKRPRRQRKPVKYMGVPVSESDGDDREYFDKSSHRFLSSPLLETSLNSARKSEKSWIAERKKPAKAKVASNTYRKQKLTNQKMHSVEESEDEKDSINMEICSLTAPSIPKSTDFVSVSAAQSCGKSCGSDVSLDNLILSPVTPYKPSLEEDDIHVVQTQEHYALSLNMDDQDNLDNNDYQQMDKSLLKILGDSGFASGPSTELRPSKSTLKRKFAESEGSVANSDVLSEEEEKSTFIPKRLFQSEGMFQVSTKKPKALSVYSDQTQETEESLQYQSGLTSFITAFGADVQQQFKARKQKLEAVTKDTLKTTQKQFNQALAQQHQQQSLLHDDFMSKTIFHLNEMTKDIDRLKEVEKKSEEFYQYQLRAFQSNEQSQRARKESMSKTYIDFKNSANKMKKHNRNVQINMKGQLEKVMSSLQHKLLQDVQKQELMNVKRGLQNLF